MACEICKKPYTPSTDDRSFDSNEKPHVCNVCGKSFSLKIQLKRHVLSHEGDVPYICNTCEKHLEQSSYNLRLSKKSGFKCETCNECFSSKRLLLRHACELAASENEPNRDENDCSSKKQAVPKPRKAPSKAPRTTYECEECGKRFTQSRLFWEHQLTHGDGQISAAPSEVDKSKGLKSKRAKDLNATEKKHVCNICSKSFSRPQWLAKHQLTHGESVATRRSKIDAKSVDLANGSSPCLDAKKHVCNVCNKSFARKSALEGHVLSHFTDGRESMGEDNSDVGSDTDADFKANIKDEKPAEVPKRQCLPKLKIHRQCFKCEICDATCASKKTYEKHKKSHKIGGTGNDKKSYQCRICNETFDAKENYKKHKLTHRESAEKERKMYTCQLCKNVFSKKRHLRKHIKCHFNIDPNETSSLSSEDIQVGKKPKRSKNFACGHCGKLFAGETCLRKHEMKHTDEGSSSEGKKEKKIKSLVCEFCQEDFTGRKHHYLKHKHSHLPEVCGICDARFVDRASLREHCRVHIGTEEGRRFVECSQKALDAKNGVVQPEPKVEYIYLVLR